MTDQERTSMGEQTGANSKLVELVLQHESKWFHLSNTIKSNKMFSMNQINIETSKKSTQTWQKHKNDVIIIILTKLLTVKAAQCMRLPLGGV